MNELSRRQFLTVSAAIGGGMLIEFGLPAKVRARAQAVTARPSYSELTAWIRIAPDDSITVAPPHMDTGQAVATSQTQLIVDELDADWSKVIIRIPEADERYGWQFEGASHTIRLAWEPLRTAGATARALLIQSAAQAWRVPPADCSTELGFVIHAGSGRRLSYGTLAAAAAKLPPPTHVTLKPQRAWRYIGKPIRKHETPDVVVGRQIYGIDLQFPDMLVACIERPPTPGAKPYYDPANALKVVGVVKVLEIPGTNLADAPARGGGEADAPRGGVVVVARDTWAAFKGRDALAVEWEENRVGESSATIAKSLADALASRGAEFDKSGDVAAAVANTRAITIEADYDLPFLAHMMMEPQNAVAQLKDGKIYCWAPTQDPQGAAEDVANTLKVKTADVIFQPLRAGGGFGRRKGVAAIEAALVARHTDGKPVKVIWKREDETHFDEFRPVTRSRVRISANAAGDIVAWDHHLASPWDESKTTMDSESLGRSFFYEVPNVSFRHTTIQTAIEIGAMRGVNNTYNVFAVETAIDELAAALGEDPFALRMRWLLKHPQLTKIEPTPAGTEGLIPPMFNSYARMIEVLKVCGKTIGWQYRPGKGRGMGLVTYTHLGTHCAVAAEVALTDKGKVQVVRIVAAVDIGTVVNPLGAKAQIEGGLVMGLSGALRELITIKGGKAEQSTYSDYLILRMPEVPAIDVLLVESGAPPTGTGEVGVPGAAPAVANAIFAATGKRIRSLPLFFTAPELDPLA